MSASKIQTTALQSAALMLGALICGAPAVRAESPWAKIAAAINGSKSSEPAAAPAAAPGNPEGLSERKADVAEVQVELNNQAPVMTMDANGQLVAAAAPGAESLAPPVPTGVTGLAVAGENKGQPTMDLGRESDEKGGIMATELFANPEILRLLGDNPRFTYVVGKLQDPMLVPWVRNAAIYNELSVLADAAIKNGDIAGAVVVLKRILDLNDEKYSAEARVKLSSIQQSEDDEAAQALAAVPVPELIELPSWVMDNTTGVVVTPGSSIALVGDDMLKAGDVVPNYPDVRIASIESKRVIYTIKDKTFEVILKNEY